ncbi:hypothetical protein K458DRAFT_411979 [Lentithecium fluviatile CBS 122367]|uniref:SH3b domain-containing protein n=1 Tax=Lentithecium fluviatile CBS 122367 TaxID=1168545 RepID=A0A6G1JK59_9PLEO|nr:hypothetical protein K458DRAFT_411979 [Lentithecium fluviatile CBS 122367]
MKFTPFFLTALLPLLTLAAPAAEPDDGTDMTPAAAATLDKRSIVGTVDADALKYRRCPRTSCEAVGQYSRGTKVTMECYTTTSTTVINGDARWAKLANGYYLSLYYMNWAGSLPKC